MSTPADLSEPEDLEHQADVARARVDETLDELAGRVSLKRRAREAAAAVSSAASRTYRRASPEITTLIRLDHSHVLSAFRRYRSRSSPARKRAIATHVCLALQIHAQLEEEIFYRALFEAGVSTEVLDKSVNDHEEMRSLIDVLRATVRRYKKNVAELGELAGTTAEAVLPHLDNDDTVLAQAGLQVKFNFDGKGEVGLNDGEASGGQQVLKSLILLVGLMKDDETPGGFVFIDEPFAHLDVRNIQLVGHFLRSTRAQYLLTTPITHNVEVFEPSEITLVTSKKPRGERWAPPIAVLARRPEVSVYE